MQEISYEYTQEDYERLKTEARSLGEEALNYEREKQGILERQKEIVLKISFVQLEM